MAVYKYTAKDINAKRITGKMEVNSRSELAAFLRSRDQYLIDCKDVTNTQQNTYKLTLKELSDFSRQLGAMIGSGVSLIRAMSILVQRESKPKIKSIYTDMYRNCLLYTSRMTGEQRSRLSSVQQRSGLRRLIRFVKSC